MTNRLEAEVAAALAEDLDQLIHLHDRELDPPTLAALRAVDFPAGLALPPAPAARAAWSALLAAAPDFDAWAADFAAIYLNNQFGASPYESVWLSEDGLACAAPMFELRALYAGAGLRAGDWRRRFDDHLVLQLQYLAACLRRPTVDGAAIAFFIDRHPGRWLPAFCRRVGERCATDFYAGLARLTADWLQACRRLVGRSAGLPDGQWAAALAPATNDPLPESAYLPGGGTPGW